MDRYLDCISVENMRESDRLTIENYVPGRTLMYRAAMGVYKAVEWRGDIAIAVGGEISVTNIGVPEKPLLFGERRSGGAIRGAVAPDRSQ